MERTGQLERLFCHLGYYCDHFDVSYLTWGHRFDEDALWAPFEEQTGAQLVPVTSVLGVARALKGCDVVRCMNLAAMQPVLRAFSMAPVVMSYGADYPALATIHGRPAWKWRALRALAMRRARTVLVPNEAMADAMRARYRRVVHHPNWVDLVRFHPTTVRPHRRWKQVLFVGRLVKEKNLGVLATAVASIPHARLVCVGDGPLRNDLIAMGAECVGAQPWTSLPYWYQGSDVFVMPSLSEGHPKALTEAMACGVPCVVSQAVTEGGDAVYRVGHEHYASAIKKMLTDDGIAGWYSAQVRAWAEKYWDVKTLMPKEIAYLRGAA